MRLCRGGSRTPAADRRRLRRLPTRCPAHRQRRRDPGPVTVLDDRRVERLLKATAATLHLGVGNYCWFTDPSEALCLKLAGTPEADQPLIGMCDSARCPQATHQARHRPVWAERAQNINSVFLGNPRPSKPEQSRAQAAFDRAQRVLAEIDAAAGTDNDGAAHDQLAPRRGRNAGPAAMDQLLGRRYP